jgi:outer membrane lipoprotein SlyB
MSDISFNKTHPVITVAAGTVILTCLLAIGVMTGIVPSPLTKGTAPQQELSSAPARVTPAVPPAGTRESRLAAPVPAHEPRHRVAERAPVERAPIERPPVGATRDTGPTNSVAGVSPAPSPMCSTCGTVSSVRAIKEQGQAGMIGPAAGGLLGGVLGHQVGGGTGKTIATIAGAAVGAGVGTEVERRYKSTTGYVVSVRMHDGSVRTVNYAAAPGVNVGDRVRLVDGNLVRD